MKARFLTAALILMVFMSCAATPKGTVRPGANRSSGEAFLMDVHGAGAQRSDPKAGNPDDHPRGMGPQGDVRRIYNLVRLVRGSSAPGISYPIVDTGQDAFYDDKTEINQPSPGSAFDGQDASHAGLAPAYRDNGDGTVRDLNTGLTWQQDPGKKLTYADGVKKARGFSLAGYSDWRMPTIKELYSLIDFQGVDPDPMGTDSSSLTPFIDTAVFKFSYGDPSIGDRIIDSQFISSTLYVSTTMGGNATVFGVNFADGRIKGYPYETIGAQPAKTFYLLLVRGNGSYGKNRFSDNGDGIITDAATGLMWEQGDSVSTMNWEEALAWARKKNTEQYLGYSDWRLPNAKELQSIVDYTRSPATTASAAIDPLFKASKIADEGGNDNYGFYWTGTTHGGGSKKGSDAVYVAFGEALGFMTPGRGPQGGPMRGGLPGSGSGGPPPRQ